MAFPAVDKIGIWSVCFLLNLPALAWWLLEPQRADWRVVVGYLVAICGALCSLVVACTLLRQVTRLNGWAVYWFAFWAMISFIFSFALMYLCVSDPNQTADPAFSEPLGRTSSLYFTLATASTTGFGDIHATSRDARLIVSAQMFLGFFLVVGVFSAVVGMAVPTMSRRDPN